MSRSCNHAIEQIYFYLDGEMSMFRRMRVRWHLRRCNNCCGAFDFEEGLKAIVRSRSHTEPPAELIQRLHTLIREEAGEEPGR